MRRSAHILALAGLITLSCSAPASADFGIEPNPEVTFLNADGTPSLQAGSHPFAMRIAFQANKIEKEGDFFLDGGAIRDLNIDLPEGFVGDPKAVPTCSTKDFLEREGTSETRCPDTAAIGFLRFTFATPLDQLETERAPLFLLEPPPGVPAKIGFKALGVPITSDTSVVDHSPYNLRATQRAIPQVIKFHGAEVTLWGTPADPLHDEDRGRCFVSAASCPANIPLRPFLTLPRSCTGPLTSSFEVSPWAEPGAWVQTIGTTPPGMTGCPKLGFAPEFSAQPTTDRAESPTGLDIAIEIEDEGLTSPTGLANSDIKKTVVTLPQGVTANPSLAEGLLGCSPAQLAKETIDSTPGEGCPEASKVGTVETETPILEGKIFKGQLFIATQDDPATITPGAENPFDTLLALYIVIKDPGLGVLVKLPVKIEPDPQTGQLIGTVDDVPQIPVSHFRLRFREGGRSPLISPSLCGTYTTRAELTPWANPAKILTTTSSFQITRGVGGGPCPPGGTPPFDPGFQAGSIGNDAGAFSPFYMRLSRRDGDQDLTRFDAKLPPGMIAKLAGTSMCADSAIAAAKAKRGRAEQASPSCPASSEIGNVLGGAGVGSQLTYAPGKLYLAGPFGGAPLSVVGIVPAVAGPFDVGTIVVRQALEVDPRSGEVEVDGALSDPIPHILAGIPLKVRDIRVYVDRPNFTLNPTSCEPFATRASIFGGFADLFDSSDDVPVSREARFQAANCASLGFKPRLDLKLRGGTKRGGHPALRGTFRPRLGDANLKGLVLRLPRSAFLDQAHIRTICTRVQFAANGGNGAGCPSGAIYGHATAYTPILEQPLEGPVYLRSSDNNLPDFVAALSGLVDVEAVARIDSVRGGIRATFEGVPDAPLSKVVVSMQGAKKGLIVNSTNLCAKRRHRANAQLDAQNGARLTLRPPMKANCAKAKRKAAKAR